MSHGGSRPNAGRPKGKENRVTTDTRWEFKRFLEHASPKIIELWETLLEENPREALNVIKDYAEFVLPKLSRVESENVNINYIEKWANEKPSDVE